MAEIVYILANPVMPGALKIGKTDKDDVSKRIAELFTTGVPVPFDCVYACMVEDNEKVEKTLHAKFQKDRISPRREFFWLSPRTAVKALKPFELTDVTPQMRDTSDALLEDKDRAARKQARRKLAEVSPELADTKTLHTEVGGK